MNILDSGPPEALRERAFRSLDSAQISRRMAARLLRGAQRAEDEAARYTALADALEAAHEA